MGITLIKANTVHFLSAVLIGANGSFQPGLDVDYEIRKISDNSIVSSGTMSEITNSYIASITVPIADEYIVSYFAPTGYENGAEQLVASNYIVDDIYAELQDVMAKLCRILGLSQENVRIFNQTYETFGENVCLTSATTRIYATAADTTNDTNHIAEYQMTATYDSVGKLTNYIMVKT